MRAHVNNRHSPIRMTPPLVDRRVTTQPPQSESTVTRMSLGTSFNSYTQKHHIMMSNIPDHPSDLPAIEICWVLHRSCRLLHSPLHIASVMCDVHQHSHISPGLLAGLGAHRRGVKDLLRGILHCRCRNVLRMSHTRPLNQWSTNHTLPIMLNPYSKYHHMSPRNLFRGTSSLSAMR